MPAAQLTQYELDDFYSVLKKKKRERAEFILSKFEEPASDPSGQPARSTITVRHGKTGAMRTYSSGRGSEEWAIDFTDDLDAGYFDKHKDNE